MGRTFEDKPATRERVPLLVGLIGPSGTGKTFSALRLGTGIQRVCGGEVFFIDTESRRALHYADRFRFRHIAFGAPFSPLDYLEAIEHCVAKGAKTIIVDSMSHEHEGPGGVLEMHEAEVKRLSRGDERRAEAVKMLAWAKPKAERRRLINSLLQIDCNFIFCFRAKEKLKIERGKDPTNLGFMPIAGEEFVYEMSAKCLLLPGANGIPTWTSSNVGEQMMIKIPEQFRGLLDQGGQLSEDLGEAMARWAAGDGAKPKVDVAQLLASYSACSDAATLRVLEDMRKDVWRGLDAQTKTALKGAAEGASERIKAATTAPASSPREPGDDYEEATGT